MVIRVAGVVKRFGAVVAVDRADLTVADGELFTLLGPSGCGKTTLLRLLAGFYQPDDGEIRFGDRLVNGLPPYERNIGMVFQNYALWPHMTVAQNVSYGLRLRKQRAAEVRARLDQALRKVNLAGFESRYPGQLSGGQQQRVALARALVLEPDILLLDEPLSNLDAKIRVQVRAEIRKLQQELSITTIYVTHDQEEALSMSDRVAVMQDGRVLQVGVPRELYERPRTRFVADFVGTNNLLDGEVVDRQGDELIVKTSLGPLRAIAGAGIDGPCVLAIRPENIAIAAAGAGGARLGRDDRHAADAASAIVAGNRIHGRVAFVSYLGNTLRYDIETAAGPILKVDIRDPWHHDPLALGGEVVAAFPASVTLAVAADT
jgi:ABC-type Fe3+/spermidine/putrescine transport system ATPase subunit